MASELFWSDDMLNRADEALRLQNYLLAKYKLQKKMTLPQNMVTSLRAPWGAGKTYLLTNWQKQLIAYEYVCVYYDAWVNDFTQDPLVGLVEAMEVQIKDQIPNKQEALVTVEGLVEATKWLFTLAPKAAAKKLLANDDAETLTGVIEGAKAEGGKQYNPVEMHRARLKYIADFKKALKDLIEYIEVKEGHKNLPLFIFIDELDRCRPTYAIEVLETVKHLFDVEGVYFVIATDLGELAHSVKAVYGEGFDAGKYLKRFFNLDYLLAEPSKENFIAHLFKSRGYNDHIFKVTTPIPFVGLEASKEHSDNVLGAFRAVCDLYGFNLRDIEQVAFLFDAVMLSMSSSQRTLCMYYLMHLLCLRHQNGSLIQAIGQMPVSDGTLSVSLFNSQPAQLKSGLMIKDYHPGAAHQLNDWDAKSVKDLVYGYKELIPYRSGDIKRITEEYARSSRSKSAISFILQCEVCNAYNTRPNNISSHIGDYHQLVASIGQMSDELKIPEQSRRLFLEE